MATNAPKDILIVEDEPEIRALIRETFEEAGFSCDVAPDGMTAVELALANDYALLVLDQTLPKLSGLDTLGCIRELGLPCAAVFLTARTDRQTVVEALRLGAVDYIEKPFDPVALLDRLPKWLEIGRGLQRIRGQAAQNSLRRVDLARIAIRKASKVAA